MNKNLKIVIPLYVYFFLFAMVLRGQETTVVPIGHNKSLSIKYSPTHRRYYTLTPVHLLVIDYEKIWKNSKQQRLFRILKFGAGIGITNDFIYPYLTVNYNYLYGINKHFFEFGVGGKFGGSVHLNIGYRLFLGKKYMLFMTLQPSTHKLYKFFSGFDDSSPTEFIDLSFGIGYRFSYRWQDKVSSFLNPFTSRLSIQSFLYPFSFDKVKEPRPSLLLKLAYLIDLSEKQQLEISGGGGFLAEGGFLYQIGTSYLIGKEKHFFEVGSNLVFASLRNPNYEYKYSNYRLLQAQLGYRYQCQKLPFFARIAYAPYIRTLDWKKEGGLKHNMVLGVGYRFAK